MFLSPDHFPPRQMAANRLIWMSLMITAGFIFTLTSFMGLEIKIAYKPLFLYLFAVCAGVSLFYRYIMHEKALFMLGECIAQLIIASFIWMTLAALGARLALPIADFPLHKMDLFIGFDWKAHAQWLHELPTWVHYILKFSYQSYAAQLALMIPMLFFFHHSDYGQRIVMMFFISGCIAALLSTIMPALGAYTLLNIDPYNMQILSPSAPLVHRDDFMAMRQHYTDIIAYPSLSMGTFPSLHGILAIMLIYCSIPLQKTRWFIIPLNLVMVLSTPFHGGHYMIDVIAGIIIGFVSIYLAERILPPRSQDSSGILNQLGTNGLR